MLVETTTDADSGEVQRRVVYTLGHDRISQTTTEYTAGVPGTPETLTFGQDGHGSTASCSTRAGAIASLLGVRQIFHYDAYGNAIGFDLDAAATTFLYSGEQTDPTGLQYSAPATTTPPPAASTLLIPSVGTG